MAEVIINPQYVAFADMVLGRLTADGTIELTAHARDLLRFTAEAWLADAPLVRMREDGPLRAKTLGDLTEIQQMLVASSIVDHVKADPHVRHGVVQKKPVSFQSLFVALADAGRRRLREEIDKGF